MDRRTDSVKFDIEVKFEKRLRAQQMLAVSTTLDPNAKSNSVGGNPVAPPPGFCVNNVYNDDRAETRQCGPPPPKSSFGAP